MPTPPELIVAFERVLQRLGLAPESCREREDRWRFEVEGLQFQAGVHSADLRVLTTICSVLSEVDVDAIYDAIEAAPSEGLAQFKTDDCYVYARALTRFADVSEARIEQMIRDCVMLAKSPAASSLKSKWPE